MKTPSLSKLSVNINTRCEFPLQNDRELRYNWPEDMKKDGVLRAQAVPRDGSCFFHSLAFLLPYPSIPGTKPGRLQDSGLNGEDLRALTMDYIDEHWEWFSQENQIERDEFPMRPNESPKQFVKRYTDKYRRKQWAGQVEQRAVAELLHAHIIIVQIDGFSASGKPIQHSKFARVHQSTWPCKREVVTDGELGDFEVTIEEDTSKRYFMNPDVVQYVPLTVEEAREIPTYVLLWHKPQIADPNNPMNLIRGSPHYSPIHLKSDMYKAYDRAAPETVAQSTKEEREQMQRMWLAYQSLLKATDCVPDVKGEDEKTLKDCESCAAKAEVELDPELALALIMSAQQYMSEELARKEAAESEQTRKRARGEGSSSEQM